MKKIVIAAALLIGAVSFSAIAQEAKTSQADDLKVGASVPGDAKRRPRRRIGRRSRKEGPYVIRLKFPAGYKVAPHSHPNDENVTVISGNVPLRYGRQVRRDQGDGAKARWICPGTQRDRAFRLGEPGNRYSAPRHGPAEPYLRE